MPLGITASLIGSTDPRPVQVSVSGLTAGDSFTVTASAGSWSRVVRGADAMTATDTSHLFVDVMCPLNVAITYTVTNHTASTSAQDVDAVTVTWAHDACVQSLDRATVAAITRAGNDDPRETVARTAFYDIPGRSAPVMRYTVASGERGSLEGRTSGADTVALRALVESGEPLVLRSDAGVRDLEPVEVLGVAGASRAMHGWTDPQERMWSLSFRTVDDPDADTVLILDTFADFNAVYAGLTFADVNTEWSGLTFGDVNALDWAGDAGRL